jgi:hypothetical protein
MALMDELYIAGADDAAEIARVLIRNDYRVIIQKDEKRYDEEWEYTIQMYSVLFSKVDSKE